MRTHFESYSRFNASKIEPGVGIIYQCPTSQKEVITMINYIEDYELELELQEIRERYGARQTSHLCTCLIDKIGDQPIATLSHQERIEWLDMLRGALINMGDPADRFFTTHFDFTIEWELPMSWLSWSNSHRQRVLARREEVIAKILGEDSSFFIHELDLDDLLALSV